MLLDVKLITPIRETNSELEAKRRRQERDKAPRGQGRREGEDEQPSAQGGSSSGTALSTYA